MGGDANAANADIATLRIQNKCNEVHDAYKPVATSGKRQTRFGSGYEIRECRIAGPMYFVKRRPYSLYRGVGTLSWRRGRYRRYGYVM